ncbi:hypothetical protein N185_32445 [Sinorhizobium sp. GW3]|nr:hypothetical protein N185_32445 [Sinorhizobium sp. GW3]
MNVNLNGEFETVSSPQETYDFIEDPQRFAPILPYFKKLELQSETEFAVTLEVGVPQIRGQSEVQTKRVRAERPSLMEYSLNGRHALGVMDAKMTFNIEPIEAGSRVSWAAEAIVSGKLASLARGILIPIANRQIKAIARSAQEALGGVPGEKSEKPAGIMAKGAASFKDFFGR